MLLENKIAVRARRIFSDVPHVWTERMEDQLMSNQNFTHHLYGRSNSGRSLRW